MLRWAGRRGSAPGLRVSLQGAAGGGHGGEAAQGNRAVVRLCPASYRGRRAPPPPPTGTCCPTVRGQPCPPPTLLGLEAAGGSEPGFSLRLRGVEARPAGVPGGWARPVPRLESAGGSGG